jgi:thiamine-monophosphate kinase
MEQEFDFIRFIQSQPPRDERILVPAGDDMAVVAWDGKDQLLLAVDQVMDGVHFRSSDHDGRAIGRKAMNRNLSDCAAMGCEPAYALLCLSLPRTGSADLAREIYLGAKEAGAKFGCEIVGGETGAWDGKTVVSLTIVARSGGVRPVTRKGAKPGDAIFVTGALGGSILGRHMTFEPRVQWGRALASSGAVTSMTDLSDGLLRDLSNICDASGVGAVLDSASVPIHNDVSRLTDARAAIEHALHDGEDYELLVTMSGKVPPLELAAVNLIHVGTITSERGLRLRDRDGQMKEVAAGGWEHSL